MNGTLTTIVLGTFNRLPYLRSALASVRAELAGLPHEIIVVDGGSTDGTLRWLLAQKDVVTIVHHNRGVWDGKPVDRRSWGYFMNLGFRAATGKYICMLSDDCLVIPGAIRNGLKQFERSAQKIAAGKLGGIAFYWRNWPTQERYWVGVTFGDHVFVNHGLYLREALETVGYIDAEQYFFYHADGDLSLRMWEAGYDTVEAEDSFIEHYAHANEAVRVTNSERQSDDWAAYEARWGALGEPAEGWRFRAFDDVTHTAVVYWRRGGRRRLARFLNRS
jgi:GT2 family glycosyltransferase